MTTEGIYQFYSQPQVGNGMPFFSGSRRQQTGGGFFGSLFRAAIPILKSFGKKAVNVLGRTATDVVSGKKDIKSALVDNTYDEIQTTINPRKRRVDRPKRKPKKKRRDIFD